MAAPIMDEDEVIITACACILLQKKKRKWVHELNRKRESHGEYAVLITELLSDEDKFYGYFRMSTTQFMDLHSLIEDDVRKQTTSYRVPISPMERLSICLRFLATGDSYPTIAYSYRVGKATVHKIVKEVCQAIWLRLQPTYMPQPSERMMLEVADGFLTRWNFPNCCGAIDGKHVLLQAPPKSGSIFYNYKGTFSEVLMALVDHNYCFIAVDIGAYGSQSDGGIFASSQLGLALSRSVFPLPPPKELPGMPDIGELPHVIVGDEAFPLKSYLMRPYPGKLLPDDQRVFNYRLSRARRVVENAFGILANKWRVYHRKLQLHPQQADAVVKATCVLHNFIRKTRPADSTTTVRDPEPLTTQSTTSLHSLKPTGNHSGRDALSARENFKKYFSSPAGAVAWQGEACFGHGK